ncbi:neurofilament heavy polypeptide-like [Dermacentor albipictus]|uniref:neurofilament heavy polypeptide-like n=1 Tax=Dermacentor albipictus TaxID=60249 RepID=UPI0031FE2448
MGSDFVVASDRAYAGPGTDTLLRARARWHSGLPSQSGTLHVTRRPSSVRRSASRERLEQEELQHGEPPVAMPLPSEAEDPQEASASAMHLAIPPSALSFKESSQISGASVAPPPELPEKFRPEASNISKEAHPAEEVRDDVRKKHIGTEDRGALHKSVDHRHAAQDTTSSTTAPKALPGKLLSPAPPTDDVHRPSKGDLCPEPGRNEKPKQGMDKLPSERSATRGFEKPAEKPAVREAAPLEADEPQPKAKQQRGGMGTVGGPEQRVAARQDSAGKNAMDRRHNPRARRRRPKHVEERQAAPHPNSVPYKPTMAMLPVQDDTTFLGGPTAGAIVKHGEQGATGKSQGVLPQSHEPTRKSVGQEGSLSSRKSTKSAESAAKLASPASAPVRNVQENPISAQKSPKSGKQASLSVSSVRVLGESAAIKRPPDMPGTKPSVHEGPCATQDAAVLAKNIPKSTVATAEQLRAGVDDRPQVPSAEEKPKRDPIPEAKREKKGKSKTRRKGHKRHHKKETG